jgi:hypothetical protein
MELKRRENKLRCYFYVATALLTKVTDHRSLPDFSHSPLESSHSLAFFLREDAKCNNGLVKRSWELTVSFEGVQ